MTATIHAFLTFFLKLGSYGLLFNEVRGAVLAVPVLYGMYQAGGSLMAIWIGFCSLAGIALSVIVPWFAAKKLERMMEKHAPDSAAEPAKA